MTELVYSTYLRELFNSNLAGRQVDHGMTVSEMNKLVKESGRTLLLVRFDHLHQNTTSDVLLVCDALSAVSHLRYFFQHGADMRTVSGECYGSRIFSFKVLLASLHAVPLFRSCINLASLPQSLQCFLSTSFYTSFRILALTRIH